MRYQIQGDNMPVVVCQLDAGETMVCEAGAMSWMSPNMEMETKASGGAGGFFGRVLSGESGFQNRYTAKGGAGMIAFTSSFPGNILAIEITPSKPIIIQKRAFLACTPDVRMEVFFQKKIGTALFGGEGFIMQKLSGSGTVFLELDGSVINYTAADSYGLHQGDILTYYMGGIESSLLPEGYLFWYLAPRALGPEDVPDPFPLSGYYNAVEEAAYIEDDYE